MFSFKNFIRRNQKLSYLNWQRLYTHAPGDRYFNLRIKNLLQNQHLKQLASFHSNLSVDKWIPTGISMSDKYASVINTIGKNPEKNATPVELNKSNHQIFVNSDFDAVLELLKVDSFKNINVPLLAKKGKRRSSDKFSDKDDKDDDKEEDDDDDDDDDGDDDVVPVDYIDMDCETGSLRLDTVMRVALPVQRRKIEELHADDKIRVNGERVPKRSIDVGEGDVIDVIHGRSRSNTNFLDIKRVKILSVPEYKTAKDRVKFKIRRWPSLTVENYQIHPFESMVLREEEEPRKFNS